MLDTPAPLVPRDADDVLQIVQGSVAAQRPLEVLGHATKRGIGRRVEAQQVLDLSALSGISLYEPDEIVLSARAGTPLAEVGTLLAKYNQELAFEPMDFGPLFGLARGGGTLGGALAANLSGPRRIKAGAARDHVLGISAVSGRGEMFKSGGRVVKNVTGYDLSKGLAGSWGTLAVLTEITFKVLPRAEYVLTLALRGLDDGPGVEALCAAMGSSAEVSAAAHLPGDVAVRIPQLGGAKAATLVRLEGFRPSVIYRADWLTPMVAANGGELARIEDTDSATLWRAVRDAEPFAMSDAAVWRVSVAPARGPELVAAVKAALGCHHYYDWSGGLVWIAVGGGVDDAGASVIRSAVQSIGGHATLIRSEASAPRFQPQPPDLAALSARLKSAFDPLNILNPGRMN